jgi:hypothetical protein
LLGRRHARPAGTGAGSFDRGGEAAPAVSAVSDFEGLGVVRVAGALDVFFLEEAGEAVEEGALFFVPVFFEVDVFFFPGGDEANAVDFSVFFFGIDFEEAVFFLLDDFCDPAFFFAVGDLPADLAFPLAPVALPDFSSTAELAEAELFFLREVDFDDFFLAKSRSLRMVATDFVPTTTMCGRVMARNRGMKRPTIPASNCLSINQIVCSRPRSSRPITG